jgi:hypothetical protein
MLCLISYLMLFILRTIRLDFDKFVADFPQWNLLRMPFYVVQSLVFVLSVMNLILVVSKLVASSKAAKQKRWLENREMDDLIERWLAQLQRWTAKYKRWMA